MVDICCFLRISPTRTVLLIVDCVRCVCIFTDQPTPPVPLHLLSLKTSLYPTNLFGHPSFSKNSKHSLCKSGLAIFVHFHLSYLFYCKKRAKICELFNLTYAFRRLKLQIINIYLFILRLNISYILVITHHKIINTCLLCT